MVLSGKLIMVTKRLGRYKNELISIFGGVKIHEINGCYVFITGKRNSSIIKKRINFQKITAKTKKIAQCGSSIASHPRQWENKRAAPPLASLADNLKE